MKRISTLLTILISSLFIISCNNTPKEFKEACERYDIYYYKISDCYVFVVKNGSYGYFIFRNEGRYYLKSELSSTGYRLYYGNAYPTISSALTAAEVRNTGEQANLHMIKVKPEIICK